MSSRSLHRIARCGCYQDDQYATLPHPAPLARQRGGRVRAIASTALLSLDCHFHTGVPMPAKYTADGTGRDTYIRRDPVECYGKVLYKPDTRVVSRFGAAGSKVPRSRGAPIGEDDPVGGPHGGHGFERNNRFLRREVQAYPVSIGPFSTMKQITQDAYAQQYADAPKHISGCTVFKPRTGSISEWTSVGEKASWPNLLGVSAETAKADIQTSHPQVSVDIIPFGSIVTTDYRDDRVRLFVDDDNVVVDVPVIG